MERIALIGYRGSGKTTIGHSLAKQLNWQFCDLDASIEQTTGLTIGQIFEQFGEAWFREVESLELQALQHTPELVLATGGGIILSEVNRETLKAGYFVMWLDASPETCWRRIQKDAQAKNIRPRLTDLPGKEEVEHLMEIRRPFYEAIAHVKIDSSANGHLKALQAWQNFRKQKP